MSGATRTARALTDAFVRVRARTEELAAPLSAEDQLLQSMPDASPTKWHRAHTTWFFETFFLVPRGVAPINAEYNYLFNSYYETLGARHARARRGMLSRPSVDEIAAYRKAIDLRMIDLLGAASDAELTKIAPLLDLGLAHEEQHQELILTDILHAFSENPLRVAYAPEFPRAERAAAGAMRFTAIDGGVFEIGAADDGAFCFDNELPRHKTYVEPYAIADRPVTVGDMKAFIADGGYRTASLWLSDGWKTTQEEAWKAPLYAKVDDGKYFAFGLGGLRESQDDDVATHLSFYEADAVARWLGGRLPTEAEWEVAAQRATGRQGAMRTQRVAWEWTSSSYAPYPGFSPGPGAIGEYNGKFMVGQYVLRGGSHFTPHGHIRPTYRNFWPPHTRFQVTGVRVAKDQGKKES